MLHRSPNSAMVPKAAAADSQHILDTMNGYQPPCYFTEHRACCELYE